jgi:hypothetical protein
MLSEIASSSWDSIQEQASQPIVKERPLPRPTAYTKGPPRAPHSPRVAFSLQAHPEPVEEPAPRKRWRVPRMSLMPRIRRSAMLAGVAVVATAVLVSGWLAVVLGGAQFDAGRLSDAAPPRLTSEIEIDPVEPLERAAEQAAPAAQEMAADALPSGPAADSPIHSLPPRSVLVAGLRDVAVHRLLLLR